MTGSDKKKTVPNPLAARKEAERMQSETTRKVAPSSLMDLDEPLPLERTPMRVASSAADLMSLDDPTFSEVEEQSPSTKRPDYEPDKFALHVESASDRMTAPPSPTYEMLRDSCTSAIAEEVPLDEEQILRPSSRKVKVPTGR
jgi:hypothetical protein